MDSLFIFFLLTASVAAAGRPKVEIYEIREDDRTGQLYVEDKYVDDREDSPLLSLFQSIQGRKPSKFRAKDRVAKELVEKLKYKRHDERDDWLNNLVHLLKMNDNSNKLKLNDNSGDEDYQVKRYGFDDKTRALSRLKNKLNNDRGTVLYHLKPYNKVKRQYDLSAGLPLLRTYLHPNQYKTAPPYMDVYNKDSDAVDRENDSE